MNFKTTILLLVLLVVVGGAFFLIESKSDKDLDDRETPEAAQAEGTALLDEQKFSPDAIRKVTVETEGKTIEIERDGDTWRQTAPVRFELSDWSAKRIGESAGELRYVQALKPGSKDAPPPGEVGLDPPKAVVTFHLDQDGKKSTHTIKVGDKLSFGGRGYVMINDDKRVYVVNSDDLHGQVTLEKITDMRKKSIDAPSDGEADHVSYVRDGQPIEMIKTDGQWAFGPPASGRVDSAAVKKLTESVGSIYIDKFVADEPASLAIYGLDRPQVVVTITSSAPADAGDGADGDDAAEEDEPADTFTQKVKRLRIGGPVDLKQEKYFATWGGADEPYDVVFQINKSYVEKFTETLDDFRDARITPLGRADMREVQIARDDPPGFKLIYSEGRWSFAEPGPGYAADTGECGKLVDAIVQAEAESYQPNAQPEAGPVVTITLAGIGRTEPDVLKVYVATAEEGGESPGYVVLRNNETTGYVVTADELKLALAPPLDFRQREVIAFEKDTINGLSITRADGVVFDFERPFVTPETPEAAEAADADSADAEAGTETETADENVESPAAVPPLKPRPGPWALAGFDQFEQSALNAALRQLDPLTAERWVASAGELNQTVSVTLTTIDGDEAVMAIDAASREAIIKGIKDGKTFELAAFEVTEDAFEKFDAEFRTRTVLDLATADIEKVTVTRGASAITVSKDTAGNYSGGDGEAMDESAAGGLFDTLTGLRAARFIAAPGDPGVAAVQIDVATKDGGAHQLAIYEGEPRIIRLNDRFFTLDDDDAEKLTAALVETDGDDALSDETK